jgi:hypothetical protein
MVISALVLASCARAFHKQASSQRASPDVQDQPTSSAAATALGLYSVETWSDVSLGNHRALLQLHAPGGLGSIAWAYVPWRLPGLVIDPQQLQMRTVSGEAVELHALSITSEAVTLLFEPVPCASPNEGPAAAQPASSTCSYHLYYLPYLQTCETGPSRACPTPYKRSTVDNKCAADHGAKVGDRVCCEQPGHVGDGGATCPSHMPNCVGYIAGAAWGQCIASQTGPHLNSNWGQKALALSTTVDWQERTPSARLVGMHARTLRDAFHPMEVAATAAEVTGIIALGRPLVVWPEDRRRPIRMLHTLPLPWVVEGPAAANRTTFSGDALRGEYYTFQARGR